MVIGASDTLGTYLPDPSQGTFPILARELPGRLHGEAVEVSHLRFYSHAKDAARFASAQVLEQAPDVVVLAAHSMAFGTPSVGARLIHLFGWSIGRSMERRIWAFDRKARTSRLAAAVRKPARRLAHRTVGVATYASVEDTIRDYGETISLLARIEDLQVIVLGTFQPRRDGDTGPGIQLNAGLAKVAAAHRLTWIDRQAIVTGLGAAAFQPNGLYSSPLVHRAVADAVLDAIARQRA